MKNQEKTRINAKGVPLRTYSPPKLTKYGKIIQLTLMGGSFNSDGGSGEYSPWEP